MDLSKLILVWHPHYWDDVRDSHYKFELYTATQIANPHPKVKLSTLTVLDNGNEILKRSLEQAEVRSVLVRLEDVRFDFNPKRFLGWQSSGDTCRLKIKAKDFKLDLTWDTSESGMHPRSEVALARLIATFESIQSTEIFGFVPE